MEVTPELAVGIEIETGGINLPLERNYFSLKMKGTVKESACPCMLFDHFIGRK